MNTRVTSPHRSVMTIPNVVMIYQPWVKKMPAELRKVAQKGDFVVKIGIS